MPDDTTRRKDAHLELCATGPVEPEQNDTLFGEIQLVHQCLPELALEDVDTSCDFLGKRLASPLIVTGMSGGTEKAGRLNRELAAVCQELGIAFGVGSQRAMEADPATAETFQVRREAPTVALVGNLGLWQARRIGPDGVRRLMESIGADGIAIHLNAGQELIQPEGDRDFRGGLKTLETLASALGERLIVKETGCGIGPDAVRQLVDIGVRTIDVSGLGGTSWVRVESLRASGRASRLGEAFSGWGIPTAACVAAAVREAAGAAGVLASGGIRDGLDVAKSLALGASMAGVALPVFRAWHQGGQDGAREALEDVVAGLRLTMVLTGSRYPRDLAAARRRVGERLQGWLEALSPRGGAAMVSPRGCTC